MMFVGNKGFNQAQCELLEKRRKEMGYTISHLSNLVGRSASVYYNIINGNMQSPSIYSYLRELHIDCNEFAKLGVSLPKMRKSEQLANMAPKEEVTETPKTSKTSEDSNEEKKEDRAVVKAELSEPRLNDLIYLLIDTSDRFDSIEDALKYLISLLPKEFKTKLVIDYIKGADLFR